VTTNGETNEKGLPVANDQELTLEEAFEKTSALLDPLVPNLGIDIRLIPGQYWFFHPGWSNLRWWWEEIIQFASNIRDPILELEACYVHLRAIEESVRRKGSPVTPAISSYMEGIARKQNLLIENLCSRLYSFREKIAWLTYELFSAVCAIYLPCHKVTYRAVRKQLKTAKAPEEHALLTSRFSDAMNSLDDEHVRTLFQFRHGFIHRIGPRVDSEESPLFIARSQNAWDSVRLGRVRSRQLVHLISHVWRIFVRISREIARVPIASVDFACHSAPDDDLEKFDFAFGIHSGVATETPFGNLTIECMRECPGFKAILRPTNKVDLSDLERSDGVMRAVAKTLLQLVPDCEAEKYHGHLKSMIIHTEDKSDNLLVTTLTENLAAPYGYTAAERALEAAAPGPGKMNLWVTREVVEGVVLQEKEAWPEAAKQALLEMMKGLSPSASMIKEESMPNTPLRRHVVFRAAPRGELESLDGIAKDALVIWEQGEETK
jgi:hypothetical protein